ncbi:dr1-associated corepressor homolog [Glossina fuscipes]|uniref:Dr1-associated corepressor homolog n=1 Tax=Glossina fuscipes TaxID=7396 RepID=A0A9C5YSH9_9MUSC|nr:dr1-associated corepressor homolog [Glossina fuscipes]
MPSKKKKYNARFPAGRIKKIMQSDEEVGKVAQAVPVIISRTLELFVESLLTKTLKITNSRNAKTLSTSHMKQCIMSEQRFDFLRELVKNIPDISVAEEAAQYQDDDNQSSNEEPCNDSDTPYDLSMPSTSTQRHHHNSFNGGGGEGDNGDDAVSPNGFTTQPKQADIEHSSRYQHVKRETPESSSHRLKLRRLLPKSSNSSSYLPTILPTANTNNVNSASVRHLNVLTNLSGTKLLRSESSPLPEPYTTQLKTQRLKHQSHSLSSNSNNRQNTLTNATTTTTATIPPSSSSSSLSSSTPSPITIPNKLQQKQTAIPAPIVSIDFCNKPVVKIDYSSLSATDATTTTAGSCPSTAPATMANTFNFSADCGAATPVINIDLSNMVANVATDLTTTNKKTSQANVVGIGVTSASNIDGVTKVSIDSKSSSNDSTVRSTSIISSKSNPCLDLDEDYDDL